MNKVCIEKSMKECLFDAFKNNAIITSDGLGTTEYIHVCNHKAYYEDGGCLGTFSETNEFLNTQDWTHNHKWFVIGYLTEEEVKTIETIRKNPRIYESCYRYEKELNNILHIEVDEKEL